MKTIPYVVEADRIYSSSYGTIVKVASHDADKLRDIISRNTRRIKRVKSTHTMTIIEGQH